jgi:hypothetical protein
MTHLWDLPLKHRNRPSVQIDTGALRRMAMAISSGTFKSTSSSSLSRRQWKGTFPIHPDDFDEGKGQLWRDVVHGTFKGNHRLCPPVAIIFHRRSDSMTNKRLNSLTNSAITQISFDDSRMHGSFDATGSHFASKRVLWRMSWEFGWPLFSK